jgi:hypothetical protein
MLESALSVRQSIIDDETEYALHFLCHRDSVNTSAPVRQIAGAELYTYAIIFVVYAKHVIVRARRTREMDTRSGRRTSS